MMRLVRPVQPTPSYNVLQRNPYREGVIICEIL